MSKGEKYASISPLYRTLVSVTYSDYPVCLFSVCFRPNFMVRVNVKTRELQVSNPPLNLNPFVQRQ
jgi:hypothetical protein